MCRTPRSDIMANGSRVWPLISSTVYHLRSEGTDSSFTLAHQPCSIRDARCFTTQRKVISSSRHEDAPLCSQKTRLNFSLLDSPLLDSMPCTPSSTCFVSGVCRLAGFRFHLLRLRFLFTGSIRLRWKINVAAFALLPFGYPDFHFFLFLFKATWIVLMFGSAYYLVNQNVCKCIEKRY